MTVSLCVIAYNEEKLLPSLLADLKAQTYPHDKTEIVLVDGMSTDGTLAVMQAFAAEDNDYMAVKVVDNPRRIQAAGWNRAIRASSAQVIVRIDAHAHIPPEFVEKNMKNIEAGEYVSGGMRPCLDERKTPWSKTLLSAENSLFGSSIGKGRRAVKKQYVDTLFHAAYRREVFDKAGLFDERLLRTEDNEMHYRVRRAGYKFLYDPDIVSYQYCRNGLRKMIRQKYGNGYWVGLTAGVCPACISLFHFVPLCFVLAIICTTVLAGWNLWQFAAVLWGLYALFAVANTVLSAINDGPTRYTALMPFIFLILHISYGAGTLFALFALPFWRIFKYKKKAEKDEGK